MLRVLLGKVIADDEADWRVNRLWHSRTQCCAFILILGRKKGDWIWAHVTCFTGAGWASWPFPGCLAPSLVMCFVVPRNQNRKFFPLVHKSFYYGFPQWVIFFYFFLLEVYGFGVWFLTPWTVCDPSLIFLIKKKNTGRNEELAEIAHMPGLRSVMDDSSHGSCPHFRVDGILKKERVSPPRTLY